MWESLSCLSSATKIDKSFNLINWKAQNVNDLNEKSNQTPMDFSFDFDLEISQSSFVVLFWIRFISNELELLIQIFDEEV